MRFQNLMMVLLMFPATCFGQSSVDAIDELPVTGKDNPDLRAFDQMMVSLVREHAVAGASLAVSRNGRLVYARGFGFSDTERSVPVEPTTRFRIASISKPITAAAIMVLVQEQKVALDDPLEKFLTPAERSAATPEVRQITVRQLLQHRGGWDRAASFDPMFETVKIGRELKLGAPADQQQLIHYMLGRPLDFEPDTQYAYSNFGYCLLGRIIERVSGDSYESYVRRKVLTPLGIQSTELGKTLVTANDETHYFDRKQRFVTGVVPGVVGENVPLQYGGWCLENMDSHGGWISTAPDLVKFADAFGSAGTVLTDQSLAEIFRPHRQDQSNEVFYGLGWQIRRLKNRDALNTWHTGSLTGTSTLLVRRHDGLNWAVLFNMRDSPADKRLSSLVDPLVHRAANRITKWPSTKLMLDSAD